MRECVEQDAFRLETAPRRGEDLVGGKYVSRPCEHQLVLARLRLVRPPEIEGGPGQVRFCGNGGSGRARARALLVRLLTSIDDVASAERLAREGSADPPPHGVAIQPAPEARGPAAGAARLRADYLGRRAAEAITAREHDG
jgi:hypothetical protein